MATITAAMVKELREATQAGMMECKKALTECDGDMKKATEYLQIKGLAKAAKRGARKTSEGVIGIYKSDDGKGIAAVEVNCETDFVARTDNFINFANDLARGVFDANPAADANLLDIVVDGEKVEVKRGNLSASTGENIRIGRFAVVKADNGAVFSYRHHDKKGAVIVKVDFDKPDTANNDAFKDFAADLVLHVFSMKPAAINIEDLDQNIVDEQRKVFTAKAAESGKPEAMLGRIADGMLNKWYAEVVLLKQLWCGEGKETAEVKLNQAAKAANDNIKISSISRIVIGEGVVEEDAPAEA